MKMLRLFEMALSIKDPWYVKGITFKEEEKQLDIQMDFKRGSKFYYKDESSGQEGYYPVHDSVEKRWRHLNFFEHECYLICRTPRVKLPDGSPDKSGYGISALVGS